jgi:hypothetical protein
MSTASTPPTRTERVLDPDFVRDLEDLAIDEVRRRRDDALAERDYLSYVRRLIQVRQDFLLAEETRRQLGQEEPPLDVRLKAVLASGPRGGSRGEVLHVEIPGDDLAEAERRVGEALGSTFLTDPVQMTDEQLAEALAVTNEAERSVSGDRASVFRVHDRFQDELKRRYREDPSQIASRI